MKLTNQEVRSSIFRTLTILAACTLFASAFGISRYSFRALQHSGFGGAVLGIWGDSSTCGVDDNVLGNTQACVWRSSNNWELELLPAAPGTNSAANAVCNDGSPAVFYVVGSSETPSGVMKPVYWTEDLPAVFTVHLLPTLGGARGEVRGVYGVRRNGNQVWFLIGGSQTSSGEMHATLWRDANQDGQFSTEEMIDLGTLGGPNSEVLAARAWDGDYGFDGVGIVGRAQTPSGQWHAVNWAEGPFGTFNIVDRYPFGVTSTFTQLGGFDTHRVACGATLTANSSSIAFKEAWAEFMPIPLAVPGFHNTTASACNGTPYGDVTVGSAWNETTSPLTIAWNTIDALSRTRPYPLSLMFDGFEQGSKFTVQDIGRGAMVGSNKPTGMEFDAPMALVADGTQLPDIVKITKGRPEAKYNETDLWHASDGKTIRIDSSNRTGQSIISLDLSFHEDENADGDFDDPGEGRFRTRIIGNANASAQVDLQVFNFGSSTWDTIGTRTACLWFCDYVDYITTPGHVNPITGEVRVRATFTPLTGSVKSVEIDQLVIGTN